MPISSTAPFQPGAHLRLDGLSKSYPDRRVLTDIDLSVSQGERLALIGENGAGKSTLLRLVAGVEQPDSGSVEVPGRVGLLWQQPPFALADTVDDARRYSLNVPVWRVTPMPVDGPSSATWFTRE